jgi:hypothetical protein
MRTLLNKVVNLLVQPPKLDLPPLALRYLMEQAVVAAKGEIGKGEAGSNNSGDDVVKYRRGVDDKGSWCAAFVCWCFEEAAAATGLYLPFNRTHGAKKLYRSVLKVGHEVAHKPVPGSVICWDRGSLANDPNPWQGHVGIVAQYLNATDELVWIDGNVGSFPARCARCCNRPVSGGSVSKVSPVWYHPGRRRHDALQDLRDLQRHYPSRVGGRRPPSGDQ